MSSIYHSQTYRRIFASNPGCPVPSVDADHDRAPPELREARNEGHWAAMVALEEHHQTGNARVFGCPFRAGSFAALEWQRAFLNEKADFIDAVAALRVGGIR